MTNHSAEQFMCRFLVATLPFLGISGLLPAAPIPRDGGKQQYYFPTRVGTKWVYDRKDGEGCAEIVTNSNETDGKYLVTVKSTGLDFKDDESITISQYAVSKDGVFVVASGIESQERRTDFDPPSCILKLPHKFGEKWEPHPKAASPGFIAGKIEVIKVPAGTFNAIRVEHGKNHTNWFAPGAGRVQFRDRDNIYVMMSFTLPKDSQ